MHTKLRRSVTALVVAILLMFVFAFAAYMIETDFGKIQVTMVSIPDPSGAMLTAKLYRPASAVGQAASPAVLCLHGFQNDKETEGAFAIELARRGFVTLALDQFGHGDSGTPSGSKDATLGGDAGYAYLKSLSYVDANNLGVMGHSMGAGSTIAVGQDNPDHKALNPKCGSAGTPELHNVLLTQARYEEFASFRENQLNPASLTTNPDRLRELGLSGSAAWDTTYGNFADGSARRQTLINTVHPGVTHDAKAVTEGVQWMEEALMSAATAAAQLPADQHIYWWKEIFTLLAMLCAIFALLPATELLLATPFFAPVAQPLPGGYVAQGWWKKATINALIAGVTWPFLPAIGAGLLSLLIPSLKLIIGNGVMLWYIGNMLIFLVIFAFWYRKAHRQGVTAYQLGVSFSEKKMAIDWVIFGKTLLLGVLVVALVYAVEGICQALWGVEFRFLWPFMRQFTLPRFGYFWVYLLPAFLFFCLNGGLFLFGQARLPDFGSERRTQIVWWLRNSFAALFGLVLIWALQYLPYFAGVGPGFDVIGLGAFGHMIPLLLFVYIPTFMLMIYLLTWFFRRTGRVYLGAWIVSILVIWFLTAGTAISG